MFNAPFCLTIRQNGALCPIFENTFYTVFSVLQSCIFSQFMLHAVPLVSDVMHQPPCGLRLQHVICGPSGIAARLNCCAKKRRMNVASHLLTVWLSYSPSKAFVAIMCIFSGEKPKRMKL